MIKEYRKIVTIKAEQFDGSDEMIKKYNIDDREHFLIKIESCDYVINTLEGDMSLSVDDWIATGVDGEHWAIKDDVFKKTYKEVQSIEGQDDRYTLKMTRDDIAGLIKDLSNENSELWKKNQFLERKNERLKERNQAIEFEGQYYDLKQAIENKINDYKQK